MKGGLLDEGVEEGTRKISKGCRENGRKGDCKVGNGEASAEWVNRGKEKGWKRRWEERGKD